MCRDVTGEARSAGSSMSKREAATPSVGFECNRPSRTADTPLVPPSTVCNVVNVFRIVLAGTSSLIICETRRWRL